MAGEGLPVQVACRVLGVSESGFYAWRSRAPSARAIRHVWLTDLIRRRVHDSSRGTYGSRRVHAELSLGRGIVVGHGAVEMLMRRASLHGLSGRPNGAGFGFSRPRSTSSSGSSPVAARTSCGSPTSPSTPPGRASCTAPSSSTCTPVGWSAGPSMLLRPRRW